MTEQPTTTAGRRLLAQMHPDGRAEPDGSKVMALIGLAYDANLERILAIEVEAHEEGMLRQLERQLHEEQNPGRTVVIGPRSA